MKTRGTFRREFNKDHPHDGKNRRYFHQSEEAGIILKHAGMGTHN
jgi:hypothetical protein